MRDPTERLSTLWKREGKALAKSPFSRALASILLVFVGELIFLYSIWVGAYGWDFGPFSATSFIIAIVGWNFGPFSVTGFIIATVGLSMMFGGYLSARNMEIARVAAGCLKLTLGFGGTFLVYGLIASFIPIPPEYYPIPTGYFLFVGLLCVIAFYKFRAYTRVH